MPFYTGNQVLLAPPVNTDTTGTPQNTTPVTVTVTLPDGTTATPTVTNPGTGQYQAIYTTAQAGHHAVSWTGGGSFPFGYTDSFDVRALTETGIISFAEAKRTLRIPVADTSEDDFVAEFNRAVTDIVEWYCGPVNQQTVVEELRVGGLTVALSKPPVLNLVTWTSVPAELATDPNRTVAQANSGPMFPVMVFGVAYPLTQLHVNKTRGIVRHTSGLPFYYGPFLWQYSAGRPTVTECIRMGSKAILKHLYGMERGGQGGSAIGQADEETTQTPFGFAVPNRALEMMAPEALTGMAAIA